MTQSSYIVIAGAMVPPDGSRWAGQGPKRDPVDQHLILQCDSKKVAEKAVRLFRGVGLYAEIHESYASARIDYQFRELE